MTTLAGDEPTPADDKRREHLGVPCPVAGRSSGCGVKR